MMTRGTLRSLAVISVLALGGVRLHAAPVKYDMNLTLLEGAGVLPTVTFTFDEAIASYTSGFTEFTVEWNGLTFTDMAFNANNPMFGWTLINSACGGPTGGGAGMFQALLNPENCGPFPYSYWILSSGFIEHGFTQFRVVVAADTVTGTAAYSHTVLLPPTVISGMRGSWTVTPALPDSPTGVPEPGAGTMLALGAMALIAARYPLRRRARQRRTR